MDLLKTQNKKRLKAVAVDFQRIWWDKGMRGGSKEGAGIWRPVPPQGYVSLGRCFNTCYGSIAYYVCACTAQLLSVLAAAYT